jgi:myo-inositol-1(or 4)-monophosphatase
MLKEALISATEAGAKVMQYYFNSKELKVTSKEGINNLVTEADHASEKAIIETVREFFPGHFILSEESGEIIMDSEYKWIIDPIDGTVNYAHGIPICCVSIGIEQKGKMIMGAVYNPFLKEFYFAEKGKGAMLNGSPIGVSSVSTVIDSCLVTGFPYTYLEAPNGPLECFERFIKSGVPVRRLGSAAMDLCWVAAGRFDAFYEHKLQAWDSAAGFLIVEESGGKVTDYKGDYYSPYQPHTLPTNGKINDEMLLWINNKL